MMKYFKTKGERIFLALNIALLFCYTFISLGFNMTYQDGLFLLFVTLAPSVIFIMYKLIFHKEE
jgi:hypothetical protein